MSHPNEELVRKGYKAFSTGDVTRGVQLFRISDGKAVEVCQYSGDPYAVDEVLA